MKQKELIQVIKYLAGATHKTSSKLCFDSIRNEYTPIESTVISEYLNNVNRFLFSGGIKVDISDLAEDDICQIFFNNFFNRNLFNTSLESLWNLTAINGEVAIVPRIYKDSYSVEYFEKPDYTVKFLDKELIELKVAKTVFIDDKEYLYKKIVNTENYIDYELVPIDKINSFDWEANKIVKPHGYKFCPAHLIKNTNNVKDTRGVSDFNYAAVRLAISCAKLERGLDENVDFFSTPLFVSPDSKDTAKRLNKKEQVLQKLPSQDGGNIDLLQPKAITKENLQFWHDKRNMFNKIMGVANPYDLKVTNLSNAALHTLNFALINKAESKWSLLVKDGLEVLFHKVLKMASIDQLCIVPADVLQDVKSVKAERLKPYFPQTMQELSVGLNVANQMFDLGIKAPVALQKTIWSHMSLETIESMMDNNRGDVL